MSRLSSCSLYVMTSPGVMMVLCGGTVSQLSFTLLWQNYCYWNQIKRDVWLGPMENVAANFKNNNFKILKQKKKTWLYNVFVQYWVTSLLNQQWASGVKRCQLLGKEYPRCCTCPSLQESDLFRLESSMAKFTNIVWTVGK